MLGKFTLTDANSNKVLFLTGSILYVFFLLILPHEGHNGDMWCWANWSELIQKKGLSGAYDVGSPINYLPLYLYVLKVYSFFVDSTDLYTLPYTLKSVALVFDLLGMGLLCQLIPQPRKRLLLFLIGSLNIAYLYNSLVWDQVDAILSFFIFASFYYGHKNKIVLSTVFFILALNFKLQAILFLPVFLILLLQKRNYKKAGIALLAVIPLQVIILLPYLIAGNAGNILAVISGSFDYYPSISMNAFNFWHLVYHKDLMFVTDATVFLFGLSHKQFGLLVFFLLCICLFLKPGIQFLKAFFQKKEYSLPMKSSLMIVCLVFCFFFFFNTQMHERYIHPALLFSTALAFVYRQWMQWILICLAYVLSLEFICKYTGWHETMPLVFNRQTIAVLYLLGISLLSFNWLKSKPFKMES